MREKIILADHIRKRTSIFFTKVRIFKIGGKVK
jgi:hypothetical protein